MAFTTEIKNEICTLNKKKSDDVCELSGFVRNNNFYGLKEIKLVTENPKVVRRVYSLFKDIFNTLADIDNQKTVNLLKRRYYFITISNDVSYILETLKVISNSGQILNKIELFSESAKRAYLRGCFLATGSINDPKFASYHMEMLIERKEEANFVMNLLNEFDLNSKVLAREKGYMVYIKKAEKIADFLRVIEANRAVLYFEDIRIYRDHKNMTNRLNNCEQANIDKIIETASKQLADIELLLATYEKEMFDAKIYEAMEYRRKYPEMSLGELSEVISLETGNNITKSGLNHRFRKIGELAENIRKNQ